MVWKGQHIHLEDDRVRSLQLLGGEVSLHENNISCHEFSSHRSWKEMWAEFKLRGEEPIDIYEKTQADPLFMEDCAGTFLLWLVMLACGPVG